MEVAIKIIQFILSLSLLIVIHELGHFWAARYFNTRVEKFYLFFNPWFSLFKKKIGETEYGIGWLPLGGYVKISGMIDESMDKEQLQQEPKPYEFRSKPAWQRLIIMVGGVFFNLILAVLIYIFMLFILGETYLPNQNVSYGIHANSLAKEIGLKHGDKIVSADHIYIEDFHDIVPTIMLNRAQSLQIIRDGKSKEVNVPEGLISGIISNREEPFVELRIPFIVEDFTPESIAKQAGLKEGDKLIKVNDTEVPYFLEFRDEIVSHAGKQVSITFERNGEQITKSLELDETGLLGVFPKGDISYFFDLQQRNYSFFAAIPAGAVKAYNTTTNYFKEIRLLFSPEVKAHESIGGFITIGSIFAPTWDWVRFWTITAFLSIILAVMNILPIPALDGGHVMFLFYEIIVGKKPSDKFMEYAQTVGMILLLSLLLLAQFNDIMRLFR